LKKQLNDTLGRVEESEKKMAELQKKNDDYRRGYNEMKTNYSKASADLEKLRGPKQPEVNE
jgi:chromosome segregation ATPase